MKIPSIGLLRKRLTLEAASRTADGGGGAALEWAAVAEVWGAVRPITGEERLRHDAISARLTHQVWIRRRSGVLPAMRFRIGTRLLDIVAVLDPGRRHRLLCLCEERS